ncbi:lymphocyte antigen 75 [Mixophyes fleayi]|uniref:lymphocyte antigen 75 n=1 Tax=Mixophyes fleayi TaxID=3061075 RepID=UPI003F4D839C
MGASWYLQLCLVVTWWAALCSSASSIEHTFQILHGQTSKCLTVSSDRLAVDSCSGNINNTLWKWGSSHRLFSLGSQKCLGLDLSKPQGPLKLVDCDSKLQLFWRCNGGHIYGASRYLLGVQNGSVIAALDSTDTWSWNVTSQNICDIPYHVVYTTGGNSYGKPCEFPFLNNGTWYHDCIYDVSEDREWCSTSEKYDADGNWGNCLKPMSSCNHTWTQNSELQQCYQFNAKSSLKWKEAYMSCRSQGADLLSISSPEELKYITENEELPESIWIGLNRLETGGGWQWSDDSPLNFVNWDQGIPAFTVLDGSSCGTLNVDSGQWKALTCDASLPYICKKRVNDTKPDAPDFWHYSETECAGNWTAYNGFCYVLQQPNTWEDAEVSCSKDNGSLISLHSLADIELVVTNFQSETENIWSGFISQSVPALFKWSDGTEAHYTYWDKNEPLPPFNVTPSCVSFSGQTGRWHVRNCSESFNSICKKSGITKNDTKSDSGCPQDQNWRRHGQYCYLINKAEVLFEARCNLTITNKFEQEFLNTLMKEQSNYFWTSLRDSENNGDYYWQTEDGRKDLSYSNWNDHEPALPGGCVAMSPGESLGKWEVKDCKNFKAQSICKKWIGSTKEEEVLKPNATTCPEGWQAGTDLYCYKLFHRERLLKQRTWEEAEGICEEFGGHLASFAHIKELKDFYLFLKSLVSDTRWIWVGLNKRNLGGWEWSDGRPISSTILDDFQEEDYVFRDCAAFEINQPKRSFWKWHVGLKLETEYSLKPFHCDARLEWVCQVPKGALLKSPEWYQPEWKQKMGPPVVIEGGEYWLVSETKLGYKEAALYCASNGSELATIDTFIAQKAIQKAIQEQMTGKAGYTQLQLFMEKWWIKSMYFRSHHHYVLHRVLNTGFSDCSYITGFSYAPDSFQSVNCNVRLPFICKSSNTSLLEIVSTKINSSSESCTGNWTSFGNKCFLKVSARYLKFKEANDYCFTHGGTLPSISSQREQDFITYLSSDLKQKFWLGLRITMNTAQNNWVDGSDVTYTNFHPILQGRLKRFEFDLNDSEKNQQCVFFLNDPKSSFIGTWDFTACSDQQYVTICQKRTDQTPVQTVVPEDLEYQGKKYKFLQSNMTWYTALSECKSKNMELVSITDQYQFSFLTVTVGQVAHPMWIGLSSKDDGTHYRWQDGNPVTLNRWSEEYQEDGDCVFMAADGTWRTESCDVELPGAICHEPPNEPKKKPPGNTIACPHRVQDTVWIPYQNNCYAFLLAHKRWQPTVCQSLHPDAYALSIRHEDENTFVFNHLQPYIDLAKWVWLGMIHDGNEKQLRWHDETFVQYSNWRGGRPTVTNNSFYAAMKLDGFWDIYPNPKDFELGLLKQHSIVACKIEMVSSEEYMKPLPSAIPYSNVTYHVLKKKLTWFEAVRECKQSDSHLASVHDLYQHLFLERIVRQDGFQLWIGLWNNDGTGSSVEWSDGTTFNYAPTDLKKIMPLGNCIFMDTKGIWRSKSCSEAVDGALCYKSSAVQSRSYSEDEVCPKTPGTGRWIHQKDFCYGFDMKIYNYSVYTSEQASNLCKTLDPTSTLLTINDEEENAFVSKYLKADALLTSRVWLGVNSNGEKSAWLNGSPMQYTNWSTAQVDTLGSCAMLRPETGTWHKVPCTPGHGRVVCKSPRRSSGAGVAIGLSVLTLFILVAGLLFYLFFRKQSPMFSTIRYRRAEEPMESMLDYS